MGVNLKLVSFQSSPETVTASLRGDVDAIAFPHTTTPVRTAINDGNLRVLVTFLEEPPELAPEATTVADAGFPELTGFSLNRLIGGPPDIPDDRQQILTDALLQTLEEDQEFSDWSEENGMPVVSGGPDAAREAVTTSFDLIEEHQDTLAEYM